MSFSAVILAAGGASRFGRPKQLLELEGQTLVQRSCQLAMDAGASTVFLVLGAHADLIFQSGVPEGVEVILHTHWQKGMGSSLALAAQRAMLHEVESLLVLLADQPGPSLATIQKMQQALREPGKSIVLCDSGASIGPPAIFSAEYFPALSQLSGEEGGRAIIRQHPQSLSLVTAPEARWDIDDVEAWDAYKNAATPLG
jgi:molybdenum cofactor cytidylyltransferase